MGACAPLAYRLPLTVSLTPFLCRFRQVACALVALSGFVRLVHLDRVNTQEWRLQTTRTVLLVNHRLRVLPFPGRGDVLRGRLRSTAYF